MGKAGMKSAETQRTQAERQAREGIARMTWMYRERKEENHGENGVVGTYPIGDSAAHTGDQSDATSGAKANHLLSHGLSGHEHSGDIDFEHCIAVFGRILQSRRLLLDPRRSEQPVHAALGVSDGLNGAV